jgi:CRISPR-associated Csx2 family protein
MKNKILISFLGTGNTEKRDYRHVKYSIDNNTYESPFVSAVISQHYNITDRIIIGTARSMWEELYRYTCVKNQVAIDEDYYFGLADFVIKSNHKTELNQIDLGPIEKCLGGKSKCVLIPYGLNLEEQFQIFNKISSSLDNTLELNDQIILDITHSFRSLPLYSTAVINYLNDVHEKKAKVTHVLYGMLDAMSEFDNIAPIIDVSSTVELNQWSKAAFAFREYGKGYLLADLLEGKESEMIVTFSDAIGINYLSEIKSRLPNFQSLSKQEIKNEFAKWLLPSVMSSFVDRLQKVGQIQHLFQFELAKWHYEKKNYSAAFIVFVESLITYVCYIKKLDWKSQKNRDEAKMHINKNESLKLIYKQSNDARRNIAHNLSRRPDSMKMDIKTLGDNLKKAKIILYKI